MLHSGRVRRLQGPSCSEKKEGEASAHGQGAIRNSSVHPEGGGLSKWFVHVPSFRTLTTNGVDCKPH